MQLTINNKKKIPTLDKWTLPLTHRTHTLHTHTADNPPFPRRFNRSPLSLFVLRDNWRSHRSLSKHLRCSALPVFTCRHLWQPLAARRGNRLPTFWLTPQLFLSAPANFLPPSGSLRSACLHAISRPRFNNCLFDISCSIKRFSNVTFPPHMQHLCLPAIVRWAIMSSAEVEGGPKDVSRACRWGVVWSLKPNRRNEWGSVFCWNVCHTERSLPERVLEHVAGHLEMIGKAPFLILEFLFF